MKTHQWQYGANPKGFGNNRVVIRPSGEFPHGGWIADCGNGDPESVANARLMAASPDLLAICEELEECSKYWSEYDVPLGIVDRLKSAILKATAAPAAM